MTKMSSIIKEVNTLEWNTIIANVFSAACIGKDSQKDINSIKGV